MNKTLYVYDLDDTLIISKTLIKLTHKITGNEHTIYTYEWNDLENKKDYYCDFSDFGDIEKLKSSTIIKENYNDILDKISKGYDVSIMTSRGEYDVIKKYLKIININIPDHLLYTVGIPMKGYSGEAPDRKKQAFTKLIKQGYDEFYFYDDSKENLDMVKTLEKTHNIIINTFQIK